MDPNVQPSLVAEKVYRFYNTLPKRGKPTAPGEWTNLAAFLILKGDDMNVVSCCTGTRCLGSSFLDETGNRLHDSHAEVMARRGFQRYLMSEIQKVYQMKSDNDSLLEKDDESNKLRLKLGFKMIFFSTQTPCGDASIYVRPAGDIHPSRKRNLASASDSSPKRRKQNASPTDSTSCHSEAKDALEGSSHHPVSCDEDLYRTGAKCVPGVQQDEQLPGVGYHITGVLRTKPGRGDPTQSHSCSDKIARWNVIGCQGCFPMIFLEKPLYVNNIILSCQSFDREAMTRAVYGRLAGLEPGDVYHLHKPTISHTDKEFVHSKQSIMKGLGNDDKVIPCAKSLIWYRQSSGVSVTEVAINGYRQGVTKNSLHTPKARLSVCRSNMLKELHSMIGCLEEKTSRTFFSGRGLPASYMECKALVSYSTIWSRLAGESSLFSTWLRKDSKYSTFTVEAG